MKILLTPILLVLFAGPSLVCGQEQEDRNWPPADTFAAMQKMIDNQFWTGGVIGWIDGAKSGTKGFGKRSRGQAMDVDGDTVFEIGSISKVFTTTILCCAVAEGKLKLSDTLKDVFKTEGKLSESVARITLEDLATHTSGLPRLPTNFRPRNNSDPYVDYDRDALFQFMKDFAVNDKARGKVAYSNLGMGILGTVLEVVLKKNYAALVREYITGPLKMKATGPSASGQNVAQGHSGKLAVPAWNFDALAGAGDLVSTAHDMLLFGRTCLSGLPAKLGMAIATGAKARAVISAEMSVGLAWHIIKKDQRNIIWHNGGTGGFSSFFAFEKKTNRALFAVVNGNGPDVSILGYHSFFPTLPLPSFPQPIKLKEEDLTPCAGRFRLAGGLILEVEKVGTFLTVTVPGEATYTLYPSAKNEFFLAVTAARCHFIPDKENNIAALVWSQGGVNKRATRVEGNAKAVEVSVADMRRLEGRYKLNKDATISIKVVGSHLEAQLTNQPSLKLRATSKSEFIFEVIDARLTFELAGESKAMAVTISQNGADQKASRIE